MTPWQSSWLTKDKRVEDMPIRLISYSYNVSLGVTFDVISHTSSVIALGKGNPADVIKTTSTC